MTAHHRPPRLPTAVQITIVLCLTLIIITIIGKV